MNMFRILLSGLVLFCSLGVLAQNPWTRLSGDPSENGLNHIQRIPESDKLIAVGEGSTILISDDIGESWQHIFNPAGFNNYYVCKGTYFIDENIGFLYGNGETILKTTDGGYHWEIKYEGDPEYDDDCIKDMVFVDENKGFAIANGIQLLKTTDGGESWSLFDIGASNDFSQFEFINNDIGFVYTATTTIYKTVDSGETWTLMDQGSLPYQAISKMSFVNENVGFIALNDQAIKLFRTEDQGLTWTEVYSDWKVINYKTGDFIFSDDMNGYFILSTFYGYTLSIIRTEDGGLTWTEEILDDFSWYHGKKFCKYNDTMSIGVGFYGSIIKSNDSGNTWTKKYDKFINGGIFDIQFLDLQNAYALSNIYGGGTASNMLLKTSDGGMNWDMCIYPLFYTAMSFLDPNIGFLANWETDLVIYKTIDGGQNWQEHYSELEIEPEYLKFINESKGIIAADYNELYLTNDGGENWEMISMSFGHIRDLEYISEYDIYTLSDDGLYYSSDGGENWEFIELEISGRDLFFLNENIAYIAGYNSIMKSADGGVTWHDTDINLYHNTMFKSIYFPSEDIGYAVGEGEYENVYKSTDGGETWIPIESEATSPLNYVYFSNNEEGVITGDLGLIMKTSSGGIVGMEEQVEQDKNEFFELYPNPSSGFVQIHLKQQELENNPDLEIIDTSGRIIKSIKLKDNVGQITVSLTNYPKGIYLIKLKSNEEILATEKLVLR